MFLISSGSPRVLSALHSLKTGPRDTLFTDGCAQRTTRSGPTFSRVSLSADRHCCCRYHFQLQAVPSLLPHSMSWVAYMYGSCLVESRWPWLPCRCKATQQFVNTLQKLRCQETQPSCTQKRLYQRSLSAKCAPFASEIPLQTCALNLAHCHAKGQQAASCPLHTIVKQQDMPSSG